MQRSKRDTAGLDNLRTWAGFTLIGVAILVLAMMSGGGGSAARGRGMMTRTQIGPRPIMMVNRRDGDSDADATQPTASSSAGSSTAGSDGSLLGWLSQLAWNQAARPWGDVTLPDDRPVGDLVTFLVTANPIPTHPDTCMIDKVLDSLPADAPKIVVLDQYKTQKRPTDPNDYDEFERRLKLRKDLSLVIRKPKGSGGDRLMGLLAFGAQFVKTPYVCAVQHDMPFAYPAELNFTNIALDMARFPELKYISFNFWSDNSPERDAKMHWGNFYDWVVGDELQSPASNNTYMRTTMWTDNNYMCRTEYLTEMSSAGVRDKIAFPEWMMRGGIVGDMKTAETTGGEKPYYWRKWGTWRYGARHLKRQLDHLEGRKSMTVAEECKAKTDAGEKKRL
eukprot:m.22536 g.22536  ORF g.22536 m.22536 type:complete len:392 (-) comp3999_c0_seq1:104-1279(-)